MKLRAEEVRADADSLAYTSGPKTRISDGIIFAICQSCFWCASCFPSQALGTITAAGRKILLLQNVLPVLKEI